MKINNRYLSGTLLVLIGILIGIILVMLQKGPFINPYAEVQTTDIKKNDTQLVTSDDLEKLGGRFLFKKVVDKVMPAVVYISSVVDLEDNNKNPGFWHYFNGRRMHSVGSGVIISKDGYIITNNHVIEGARKGTITVGLYDKRTFEAIVVGTDPTTDLAVLKIDANDLEPIIFGNSNNVAVGEWVLAIGNPFRLRSTVTAGIVSALSRQISIGNERNKLNIENFIQTDAAINKGNSGGALVNTSGQLIGVNTAIASNSGTYQGYGFAIPSNLVRHIATELIENGKIERAILGVSISTVSELQADKLGMHSIHGVEIVGLQESGAAAKAGLKANDVILSVNGMPVNEASQLQQKIAILEPGQTVKLKIWRNGDVFQKEVVLGKVDPETQLTLPK